MIQIYTSLSQVDKNTFCKSVYDEAIRILEILYQNYGDQAGGLVAICSNKKEYDTCLSNYHAEQIFPEWTKKIDDLYQSQLFLISDDYALVIISRKEL